MPSKLLLADDSVTIQRVIELTFADEDVQVVAVSDGKQAIEHLQSERPDIVLADVGMPERDGYDVAAFIKGQPHLSHIPVLLLTGAFEPIDEVRARTSGCDGVLVKPFEPQMVISRVRDLLAGRRPSAKSSASTAPEAAPRHRGRGEDPQSRAASLEPKAGGDALEDYFDRLDAALASMGPPPASAPPPLVPAQPVEPVREPTPTQVPAAPAPPRRDFAAWDPELGARPVKPAPYVPSPFPDRPVGPETPARTLDHPSPSSTGAEAPAVPSDGSASREAAPVVPPLPSLSEAFAALLSAEAGLPLAPSPLRSETIDEGTIELIARRVIDRMGSDSMRQAVLDVAERIVREEIERIKAAH